MFWTEVQPGEVYIYKGEKVMITRYSSAARMYRYNILKEGGNVSKTEDKAVFDANARLYAPKIKRGDIYKTTTDVYVKILSIVAVEDKIRYETLNRRLPDTTSSFYNFTRRFSFVAREMRLGDIYKKDGEKYYIVKLNPLRFSSLYRDDSINVNPMDVFRTWEFEQSGPREGEEWRSLTQGITRTVEEVIEGFGTLEVDLSNYSLNPPMWSFLREYKPLNGTKLPWNAPAARAPAARAPAPAAPARVPRYPQPDGRRIELGDEVSIREPGNTIARGVVTEILPEEIGVRVDGEDLCYELDGLRITLKSRAGEDIPPEMEEKVYIDIKNMIMNEDLEGLKAYATTKGVVHIAVHLQKVNVVKFLLTLDVDVNFFQIAPDKPRTTALALALFIESPQIQEAMVDLLLPVSDLDLGVAPIMVPVLGMTIHRNVTFEVFKKIVLASKPIFGKGMKIEFGSPEQHMIFHAIEMNPTVDMMAKIKFLISEGMDLKVKKGIYNPFEYALKKSAMYTKKDYLELAYLFSQHKPAIEPIRKSVVREFITDLLQVRFDYKDARARGGYKIRRDILIEFIRNTTILGEENNFVKILNIHRYLSEQAGRYGGDDELMDDPFPKFKQSVKEYLEKFPGEDAGILQQIIDERAIAQLYYAFEELELDANTLDSRGVPLIFAVINKEYGDPRKDMLDYMMKETDVNYILKNIHKEVPLQFFVRRILKHDYWDVNYEVLKTMIEKIKEDDMSKEIFNNQNKNGDTMLHYTVADTNYNKPYYELLKKYVDPSIKNNYGESIVFSVHQWVYSDPKYNLGEVNKEGMSVFMDACLHIDDADATLRKMRYILKNAPDKTFVPDAWGDQGGTTVLEWLLRNHPDNMYFEPFLEEGLNPNLVLPSLNQTIMMQAVYNDKEYIERLIPKYIDKIDLNLKNGDGYNLLAVIVEHLSDEGLLQSEADADEYIDLIKMMIAKGSKTDGVLELSTKFDLRCIIDLVVTPREHYIYDLERINKSLKAKCKGYTKRNPGSKECKGYSGRLKKNNERIKELKQMTDEEYQKMLSLLQAGEMSKCANKEDLILFMPWEAEDYRNTLFLRLEKDGKAMVWCFVNKVYPADPDIPGDTEDEVKIDDAIKNILFANWVNQDGTPYEANMHGRGGTTGDEKYIQMRTSNGAKYYLMYDDLLKKLIREFSGYIGIDESILDWRLPIAIHAKYEKRVAISNADGSMGVSQTHGTRAEDIYVVQELINLDSRERIDRGKACVGTCLKF